MTHIRLALILAAVLGAAACSPRYIRSTAIPVDLRAQPGIGLASNVIVVSVDGLRPDAIRVYDAPTLQRLMREGSYTLAASTIHPSKTLPSHTSMLTGQPPERHGVLWNNVTTADADAIELPNIFSVARAHGYSTAAFFSKAKFQPLQLQGTLDYSQAPGGWFGRWSSEQTMTDVEEYLASAKPQVLFVHMTDPDAAGHRSGWMSPTYGKAVLAADAAINRLVTLATAAYGTGNFSLIVTADHGGHGTNHGSDDVRDVTIPWIAWGQGVQPGQLTQTTIRTMDTAATVLWLLGVPEPNDWAGEAVVSAYAPRPATSASAGTQ
jgi:predicted AlkP superfamily pyrophosphatase or phosphodiesterase